MLLRYRLDQNQHNSLLWFLISSHDEVIMTGKYQDCLHKAKVIAEAANAEVVLTKRSIEGETSTITIMPTTLEHEANRTRSKRARKVRLL